ncbi:MAG: cytidine deaminase [Oscillospiraceae bacterium]|nr:cytidine deaminase [Oscillospiraceae bacterium]
MSRIDKENYYLDIAETVLERATCSHARYGALIVRNDEIVSTGYNGAPRGRSNCIDLGYCVRRRLNIPPGERYELCRSVPAEANAIISAARSECIGGTIYLVGRDAESGDYVKNVLPSAMGRRMIINAGLSKVIIRRTATTYDIINVQEWVFNDDSIFDPSESKILTTP